MTHYRCYFLATGNPFTGQSTSIDAAEDLDAETDDEARAQAKALYRRRRNRVHGFEVWQGDRLVLRLPSLNPEHSTAPLHGMAKGKGK